MAENVGTSYCKHCDCETGLLKKKKLSTALAKGAGKAVATAGNIMADAATSSEHEKRMHRKHYHYSLGDQIRSDNQFVEQFAIGPDFYFACSSCNKENDTPHLVNKDMFISDYINNICTVDEYLEGSAYCYQCEDNKEFKFVPAEASKIKCSCCEYDVNPSLKTREDYFENELSNAEFVTKVVFAILGAAIGLGIGMVSKPLYASMGFAGKVTPALFITFAIVGYLLNQKAPVKARVFVSVISSSALMLGGVFILSGIVTAIGTFVASLISANDIFLSIVGYGLMLVVNGLGAFSVFSDKKERYNAIVSYLSEKEETDNIEVANQEAA